MIYFMSSVLICFCTGLVSSQNGNIIVDTNVGKIKGNVIQLKDLDYYTFLGIPYAKPPTDALRFKDPVPADPNDGIIDALNFQPKCPQWDRKSTIEGKEDCLFLNIFTPHLPADDTYTNSYPVMVFIHGGNFERGSADPYNAEPLIGRQVLVVTLNYRLGILGFLSTGDTACPGNLGLKDQVLALKWVQNNIDKFGGDPKLVTLFGQGAGAVSTFLHILSPQSKDLFHRAITQSGSPLCDWTMEENPLEYAQIVAQKLGCAKKSTQDMFECIRQQPLDRILMSQRNEEKDKAFGGFPVRTVPVVDKNGFLPEKPLDLLKSSKINSVPLISGINKDDGAFFYRTINSYQENLRNKSYLSETLIPLFLRTATDLRENIQSISKMVDFQYFSGLESTNMSLISQAFIEMASDSMFVSCNYKTVETYSAAGADVYMYIFDYRGENSMIELENDGQISYPGVSHGDELLYLFNIDMNRINPNTDTKRKGQMRFLWATFAKEGIPVVKPSLEYKKWDSFSKESKNYYSISSDLQTLEQETSYRQREVEFWLEFLPAVSRIKEREDRTQYTISGFGWTMMAFAIILLVIAIALGVVLYRKRQKYATTPSS